MNRQEFFEKWVDVQKPNIENMPEENEEIIQRGIERNKDFLQDFDSVIKDEGLLTREERMKLLVEQLAVIFKMLDDNTAVDLALKIRGKKIPILYTAEEASEIAIRYFANNHLMDCMTFSDINNILCKAFGIKEVRKANEGCEAKAPHFSFFINDDAELIKLDKTGFYYMGELVEDKYNVYERFNEWLKIAEVKR